MNLKKSSLIDLEIMNLNLQASFCFILEPFSVLIMCKMSNPLQFLTRTQI